MAKRSRGRVTPCAVCTVHMETRRESFLVEPQNHGRQFVSGLASKPLGRFSPIWPQNWWWRFLPVWPQNWWLGFHGLGLKTGSYGLVIWALKSSRRLLGFDLKTKQTTVCRLRHKTDRRATVWDTRRDLVASFTWKQVGLGFPNLPQDWRSHDGGWCMWYHHGDCVESKLKMNGSIRWAASVPSTPESPFFVLDPRGI
jgi:hypothetical protein